MNAIYNVYCDGNNNNMISRGRKYCADNNQYLLCADGTVLEKEKNEYHVSSILFILIVWHLQSLFCVSASLMSVIQHEKLIW